MHRTEIKTNRIRSLFMLNVVVDTTLVILETNVVQRLLFCNVDLRKFRAQRCLCLMNWYQWSLLTEYVEHSDSNSSKDFFPDCSSSNEPIVGRCCFSLNFRLTKLLTSNLNLNLFRLRLSAKATKIWKYLTNVEWSVENWISIFSFLDLSKFSCFLLSTSTTELWP